MTADVMCDERGFCVRREGERCVIDAGGLYYRQLNEHIRAALEHGVTEVELLEVRGQRYIATAVEGDIRFTVHGVPGQDLGSFMRGPTITAWRATCWATPCATGASSCGGMWATAWAFT